MYAVPSLGDLMARARKAFRANLKGSDAWVWPNNVYVSAKVLAGMTFEVFGFASYISRQKFAVTAPDLESLKLHGEEFGISQNPAAPARGKVIVTTTVAFVLDGGAVFRRADGVEFISKDAGSTTGAGSFTVRVEAAADGKAGTTEAGTPLEIVSGGTGDPDALAEVDGDGLAYGADVEDIESYRARILFRKRNPPHGGSAADYVLWAGEVPGVSFYADRPTVYVERLWSGPGTVRVFPLMFDLYESGIPAPSDVARVRDHIEALRPAGARVAVAAPTPVVVDVEISGLAPDRSDVREAVRAELRDVFRRRSRVAGTDSEISNMPYLAYPASFSRSWIWQAVANATGEERHTVVSPSADIALDPGEMAVLGDVSFV